MKTPVPQRRCKRSRCILPIFKAFLPFRWGIVRAEEDSFNDHCATWNHHLNGQRLDPNSYHLISALRKANSSSRHTLNEVANRVGIRGDAQPRKNHQDDPWTRLPSVVPGASFLDPLDFPQAALQTIPSAPTTAYPTHLISTLGSLFPHFLRVIPNLPKNERITEKNII